MWLMGLPVIYYVRDGLGLATGSPIFTVILNLGPLGLCLLFLDYRYFNSPNKVAYSLGLVFLFISFIYFFLRDPYTGVVAAYEYFNFSVIFFLYFSVLFLTQKGINRNFVWFSLIIAVLGSILLLWYIYNDPLFAIGQRASIKFSEKEDAFGNPHIYAKVAYFGLILSLLSIKYKNIVKIGVIIPFVLIVVFLIVLFFTQTMLAFLATFLFFGLYLFYNFNFIKAYSFTLGMLKKWYVLVILVFGIVKGVMFLNENADALKPATNYIENRIDKIVNTVFSAEDNKNRKSRNVDESASMRVHLILATVEIFEENFTEGKFHFILFGNGYKHLYLDVPHLEVFDSFGFFMFVFYTVFFIYMIKITLKEMKKPKSITTEFIAYGFIYFFVYNFTGGLIIDYTRWGYYALVCRFFHENSPIIKSKILNFKEDLAH